jgi:hypothetical protein
MTGTRFRKHRVSIIAIAAMLLAGASSFAVAQQRTAAADAKMQALADEAALAGVNALAATEGQTDAKRLEAANAAVRKVIASHSGIAPIVSPSIDEMKMSVALPTNRSGRGPAFTATAHYVQPGSPVSPGPTADAFTKKRYFLASQAR